MRGILFLLLLVVESPAAVRAARLDCAEPDAQPAPACREAGLSAAAGRVQDAYQAALGQLSPDGRRLLEDEQTRWLRYVDAACPRSTDPASRDEQIDCLMRVSSERDTDLQSAAVRAGPFLFGRVDAYEAVAPDPQANPADPRPTRHHLAFPRVDAPATPRTAQLNALLVRNPRSTNCADGHGDIWDSYELGLVTADVISVTWTFNDYCRGAAHGFGGTGAQTVLLSPEPHQLVAADLFRPDTAWADRLGTLLLAGVRRAAEDSQMNLDERDAAYVAQIASDTRRWLLGADGLGVQFDNYELGSYVFRPRVVVPWADLRDVMVLHAPVP